MLEIEGNLSVWRYSREQVFGQGRAGRAVVHSPGLNTSPAGDGC
jgi:hypothetical protein